MTRLPTLPLYTVAITWAALLAGPAALAQKQKEPPTLLGRWETRQISFTVTAITPDSVRDKAANSEVANLNDAIFTGQSHLVVEFRADSTYQFTISRTAQLVPNEDGTFTMTPNGQVLRNEAGTYSLAHGHLSATSPGSPDGSSFNDQQVQKLTRRQLVLTFPMGSDMPGVTEIVEYRRVGPFPKSAGVVPGK